MPAIKWVLAIVVAALGVCGAVAALAGPAPARCGERNYIRLDGRSFRHVSLLYYWPAAKRLADSPSTVVARVPVEAILGPAAARQRPRDLRVIDGMGRRRPFCVLRKASPVAYDREVRAGDVFCVCFPDNLPNNNQASVAAVLFGGGRLRQAAEYGPLAGVGQMRPMALASNDWERGLLDYTGPIDLRQPAARIQLDLIYSARWNLWYEFALWTQMPVSNTAVPPMLAVPFNPLTESTHFNMDDVPRFPLYYLRYFRLTGDRDALRRARLGLQTIIAYTRSDGTMPYMLAPWNGKHSPPGQLVDTYHSMRAVAEGIPAFRRDRAFAAKLIAEYELLRGFVHSHLNSGLFFGRASGNGAVIEAVYHRWLDTSAAREMKEIRQLADAILTLEGRAQMSDFGENMPWAILGLARAYQATADPKYLREADLWLEQSVVPSLKLDRRYYTALPDLKPSGPVYGENPLSVWYHADALLTLYEATGRKRYYDLAAWVYGDYYDLKRYGERAGARIVDTGDPETECWGAACAEDALRMIAKYDWQIRYPSLWSDARARRDDKSGPTP